MALPTSAANKTGALGSIVSAMGCGLCFPAIASFGAAIGLGFLSQYESLLLLVVMPLFATVALVANGLGWRSHRQWHRAVLGMVGPIVVLIALFTGVEMVLYAGLAAMVGMSIWDFVSPASRHCGPDGCELPAKPV